MADRSKAIPIHGTGTCTSDRIEGVRIGTIVRFDNCGRVLVTFIENDQWPVAARLTSSAKEKLRQVGSVGREVLLAFENGDPECPVIIDTMFPLVEETEHFIDVFENQKQDEITVDGKRVVVDAEEEIVLRCGEASITLTKAGKVLIKGNYVISQSAGANRIKGGSVQIN